MHGSASYQWLFYSYCDCFAVGLFCTEPCACQGCLNIYEEKEAVLAAREQIETRNPLAFAPKIVQSDKGQAATDGVHLPVTFFLVVVSLRLLFPQYGVHRKMKICQHHHQLGTKRGVIAKGRCVRKNTANVIRYCIIFLYLGSLFIYVYLDWIMFMLCLKG